MVTISQTSPQSIHNTPPISLKTSPHFCYEIGKGAPLIEVFSKENYLYKRHLHNHINELYATQVLERDLRSFIFFKNVWQDALHAKHIAFKFKTNGIWQSKHQKGFQVNSNQFAPFWHNQARYSFFQKNIFELRATISILKGKTRHGFKDPIWFFWMKHPYDSSLVYTFKKREKTNLDIKSLLIEWILDPYWF